MIDAQKVMEIHDLILSEEPGLQGNYGIGPVEGALSRVINRIEYQGLDDVFEIAAMYAVALARGHVFTDANKRTALVTVRRRVLAVPDKSMHVTPHWKK